MKNNSCTVLIADKDNMSAESLKRRLIGDGFRVFSVDSGRSTVSCVRKRNIDVAVVDVNLKDMEGYKIVPLIKDIKNNIKVIMTTSNNSIELESKCRETGIIYYAIKPCDDVILNVVSSVIIKS